MSTPVMATPDWVGNLQSHGALQEISPEQRQDTTCLALAIYFEARGESTRGQQAVGNVVMNRIRSGRYPTTACEVLFQKGQFSFIHGSKPVIPRTESLWTSAINMAHSVLNGSVSDASHGALSFCNYHLHRGGFKLGNHVFY